MQPSPLVQIERVHVDYQFGQTKVQALKGLDLEISSGEFVALAGSSGSGKTTLLNLMGALEKPTSGRVLFESEDIGALDENSLSLLRASKIGFVFQTFNLIPVLTALENVEYGMIRLGLDAKSVRAASRDALARVGLEAFVDRRPDQLSGGQRQRVAIARALAKTPRLLLADEPTANLDSKTAAGILDLLSEINRKEGVTLSVASHDPVVFERAHRVVRIADGARVE